MSMSAQKNESGEQSVTSHKSQKAPDREFWFFLLGSLIGLIPFLYEKCNPPIPPLCKLLVYSNVDGAGIYNCGNKLDHITKADSAIMVGGFEPGTYLVKVKKPGYQPYEITVNLLAEYKTFIVNATLDLQKKASDVRRGFILSTEGNSKRVGNE